ncbi:MAG: sigma-54-dependent Fis family transcriptional regulator [Chitinophagaceae bacterium]|nr:sigma-54-dependent Fis family transcriptional regulator [Chitinophagaceae bacterium]
MNTVLIIDDEEGLRRMLSRIIALEGYNITEAGTLKEARKKLAKEHVDIVLCDVRLPDGNGVEFTAELRRQNTSVEVILLTAYGDVADSVQAMKNGAFDYIVKGNDNIRLIPLLARAVEQLRMKTRIAQLEKQSERGFESIIGTSPSILQAKELAEKVAHTDTTVLLLGETGTGKEVFANAIHNASPRKNKPFLALNCSSFSRELLESELFGYKAGAFTNAQRDKKGLIEEADGGTLFLDEIGEMPHDLQSKLLRVLESCEFIKLGDTKVSKADVRIIAATNRDLQKEVGAARFREDLFYRLNVFTIILPSLRERQKDIPLLASHFIEVYSKKSHSKKNEVTPGFVDALKSHPWKGNIRELKNIIERAVILAGNGPLLVQHLPQDFFNTSINEPSANFDLASIEQAHIRRVLQYTNNNKAEAARLLNIGIATLYRKIGEQDDHR